MDFYKVPNALEPTLRLVNNGFLRSLSKQINRRKRL
nr:MAG TPA: hypothetical protein [Caudoviricetes sp.]